MSAHHRNTSHDIAIPDPYQTTPSPSPQKRSLPDTRSSSSLASSSDDDNVDKAVIRRQGKALHEAKTSVALDAQAKHIGSSNRLLFRAPPMDLDDPYGDDDDDDDDLTRSPAPSSKLTGPPAVAKKGWLAHQSVFPAASSSRSQASASATTSPPASIIGDRHKHDAGQGVAEEEEEEDGSSSSDPDLGESYDSRRSRARRSRNTTANNKIGTRSFFGFPIPGPSRWSRAATARHHRNGDNDEDDDGLLSDLDDALGPSRHAGNSITGAAGPTSSSFFARRVSPSSLGSLETLDYGANDDGDNHGDSTEPLRRPGAAILKDGGRDIGADSLESVDRALDDPLVDGDDTPSGIPQRLQIYSNRLGHWKGELPLKKYKDSSFLALWLFSLLGALVGLCFVWGNTDPTPVPPSAPHDGTIRYRTPFSTLLHTIPLLGLLVVFSTIAPLGFIVVLRKTVRPCLFAMTFCVPFFLVMVSWWSFIASFEEVPNDVGTDHESDWWGTTGLRILSLIPLILAGLFGHMMWKRRKRLERTVAVVELSSALILQHPAMLLLSPAILIAFAAFSLPFLTLILRLLLVGYYRHPRENTYIWHVRPYAGWLIAIVTLVWLWSWVIFRGIGRVVMAAIIGEWYFYREDANRPTPSEVFVAGLHRATGPNLGSICLSSLIVASSRAVGRISLEARRITHPRSNMLPGPLMFLQHLTPLFTLLASVLEQLNGYALVYVGVTGDAFWPSATRAVKLASRRRGAVGRLLDYTLVKLLLTLSATTIALISATIGYLYVTHGLSAPSHAPIAAFLCGGVSFLAVRAGCGVLADATDSIFICYAIDRENGTNHCDAAAQAFESQKPTATV